MNHLIRPLFNKALNFILPQSCYFCSSLIQQEKNNICQTCITDITIIKNLDKFCNSCGRYKCICKEFGDNSYYYDKIHSIYLYDKLIAKVIKKYKYKHDIKIAKLFAKLITDNFHQKLLKYDIIITVPSHVKKTRSRSFNQMELITRFLPKALQSKINKTLIKKIKNTQAQASMDDINNREERLQNLSNAFQIIDKNINLTGKKIVILDDVVTTGSTVNEIARSLKSKEVRLVDVVSISRVVF